MLFRFEKMGRNRRTEAMCKEQVRCFFASGLPYPNHPYTNGKNEHGPEASGPDRATNIDQALFRTSE